MTNIIPSPKGEGQRMRGILCFLYNSYKTLLTLTLSTRARE